MWWLYLFLHVALHSYYPRGPSGLLLVRGDAALPNGGRRGACQYAWPLLVWLLVAVLGATMAQFFLFPPNDDDDVMTGAGRYYYNSGHPRPHHAGLFLALELLYGLTRAAWEESAPLYEAMLAAAMLGASTAATAILIAIVVVGSAGFSSAVSWIAIAWAASVVLMVAPSGLRVMQAATLAKRASDGGRV